MKLLKSDSYYSFGNFKKVTDNAYNVVEFLWPVKARECYATKIDDNGLDALALTILELLNLEYCSIKNIADDLDISTELVEYVIDHELISFEYCEKKGKDYRVTTLGQDYIKGINTDATRNTQVFGYMFQSMLDGEFLPVFVEGKLPDPRYITPKNSDSDELFLLDVKNADKDIFGNSSDDLLNRINRAYHKYGYIYKKAIEQHENSLFDTSMFVDDEDGLEDQDFDFAASDEIDVKDTIEVKEELKNLRKARVKLLKTPAKDIYVKFRLYTLKDDPETFIVTSPFEVNETKWYTEALIRMRNDKNVCFGLSESSMIELNEYCNGITKQMFFEIPELKELKPDEYMRNMYPEILNSSMKNTLIKLYRRIINQETHALHGEDNEIDVLMNVSRALEVILNNYINREDHNRIVDAYFNSIAFESDIDAIPEYFGIDKDLLSTIFTEKKGLAENPNFKKVSIMRNFWNRKAGISLREKYYFMMYAAYLNGNSNFAKAIHEDKNVIIYLDEINKIRNPIGAHNEGTFAKDLSRKDMDEVLTKFKLISKILVSNFD